ncbi:alpha/beta fold hydrolase [Burkholderia ubonensis]|uniref:alpha/beta fold hydrolase n=1 Tax=Burkholderia ubonensis TaxID=101571 RepID=UPI00210ABD62|nr:alpha/beta hydrolase [Burkholderia ubonensis]
MASERRAARYLELRALPDAGVGDKDPGLDSEAMQHTFLAWHPNAELHVISNCGHYPMQECPPYFATVIEHFLKRKAT